MKDMDTKYLDLPLRDRERIDEYIKAEKAFVSQEKATEANGWSYHPVYISNNPYNVGNGMTYVYSYEDAVKNTVRAYVKQLRKTKLKQR